jgi:hypothetical protein
MTETNQTWSHPVPTQAGLYWRTVHTSIGSWITDLVALSVEERLDGSKIARITSVTPVFLPFKPEPQRTDKRFIVEGRNNHAGEYFSGPISLPEAPAERDTNLIAFPREPGLYFQCYQASDASGWRTILHSVSILRAFGHKDYCCSVSLPDLQLRECEPSRSSSYSPRLPIQPPTNLPYGEVLVLPETTRQIIQDQSRK